MSNKKLLFDGNAIQYAPNAKFHGGSEFGIYILKRFIQTNKQFFIAFNKNKVIRDDIKSLIVENNVQTYYFNNHKELYDIIEKNNFDIFYSVLPYEYADYHLKIEFKGVIHGLRNIEIPWEKYKHKHVKGALKRHIGFLISKCNILIELIRKRNINKIEKLLSNPYFSFVTVSEHSKYSIKIFFPQIDLSKIRVVYSPIKLFDRNIIKEEKSKQQNYYLCISANRFEKNPNRLVKAFDILFTKGLLKDKKVVLCGVENKKAYGKIRNKDKFIFIPYVSETELTEYILKSYCFVYPSLNEGFGYPPLQAMHLGIPVLASSSTSIPEVCGDAVLYFSPENIYDICNRILQIENNRTLYNDLIIKGNKRVGYILTKQKQDISEYIESIFR